MTTVSDTPLCEALWADTLLDLSLKMARETYETQLTGTRAVDLSDGTLTVSARSEYAVSWLDSKLRALIERTVARVAADRNLQAPAVRFVARSLAEGPAPPSQSGAENADSSVVAVELVEFDPLRRGYVQCSSYALRFWLPYLGRGPFVTWLVLKSYAYAAEAHGHEWPAIATLADVIGSTRQQLTGRRRGHEWQQGWLEVLRREKLVSYEIERWGRYAFRVLESLPLLTAVQVAQLPEGAQEAHARWLEAAEVDAVNWQNMTVETLVGTFEV